MTCKVCVFTFLGQGGAFYWLSLFGANVYMKSFIVTGMVLVMSMPCLARDIPPVNKDNCTFNAIAEIKEYPSRKRFATLCTLLVGENEIPVKETTPQAVTSKAVPSPPPLVQAPPPAPAKIKYRPWTLMTYF